jgi:hypothetical protein
MNKFKFNTLEWECKRYHSKEYIIPLLFGLIVFHLLLEQRNEYKWKLFINFSLLGYEELTFFNFQTSVEHEFEDEYEDTYLGYINHKEVNPFFANINKHP